MLYQKGEKFKELVETVKSIPTLSGLKESNFILSPEDYNEFTKPITALYSSLANALFNTLLISDTQELREAKKNNAINNIIDYIKKHYKEDLIANFYEEKLKFYDYMFSELISEILTKCFPDCKHDLEKIESVYANLFETEEIFNFSKVKELIMDYKHIDQQLRFISYDRSTPYLINGQEMVLEQISEIIKEECKIEYKNPAVLPNRLRKLIYLVKTELKLDLGEEDKTEE